MCLEHKTLPIPKTTRTVLDMGMQWVLRGGRRRMRHDTIGYTCTPLVMSWVCMVIYSNLVQEATQHFLGVGVYGELAESLNSVPFRAAWLCAQLCLGPLRSIGAHSRCVPTLTFMLAPPPPICLHRAPPSTVTECTQRYLPHKNTHPPRTLP